jgi:hypothetical protein
LQEQAASAHGEMKVKLEKRITEVRVDYVKRATKLNQVWQLTEEALTG